MEEDEGEEDEYEAGSEEDEPDTEPEFDDDEGGQAVGSKRKLGLSGVPGGYLTAFVQARTGSDRCRQLRRTDGRV